jgi:cytochrome b
MKPYLASLINAALLIILGLWAYFSSDTPSFTALIPVIAGVILLLLNSGIKKENKTIAHIAVVITLLVLIGLIKPLTGALGRDDSMAVTRVIVMILSTLVALISFIKSFVDARKNRAK